MHFYELLQTLVCLHSIEIILTGLITSCISKIEVHAGVWTYHWLAPSPAFAGPRTGTAAASEFADNGAASVYSLPSNVKINSGDMVRTINYSKILKATRVMHWKASPHDQQSSKTTTWQSRQVHYLQINTFYSKTLEELSTQLTIFSFSTQKETLPTKKSSGRNTLVCYTHYSEKSCSQTLHSKNSNGMFGWKHCFKQNALKNPALVSTLTTADLEINL